MLSPPLQAGFSQPRGSARAAAAPADRKRCRGVTRGGRKGRIAKGRVENQLTQLFFPRNQVHAAHFVPPLSQSYPFVGPEKRRLKRIAQMRQEARFAKLIQASWTTGAQPQVAFPCPTPSSDPSDLARGARAYHLGRRHRRGLRRCRGGRRAARVAAWPRRASSSGRAAAWARAGPGAEELEALGSALLPQPAPPQKAAARGHQSRPGGCPAAARGPAWRPWWRVRPRQGRGTRSAWQGGHPDILSSQIRNRVSV